MDDIVNGHSWYVQIAQAETWVQIDTCGTHSDFGFDNILYWYSYDNIINNWITYTPAQDLTSECGVNDFYSTAITVKNVANDTYLINVNDYFASSTGNYYLHVRCASTGNQRSGDIYGYYPGYFAVNPLPADSRGTLVCGSLVGFQYMSNITIGHIWTVNITDYQWQVRPETCGSDTIYGFDSVIAWYEPNGTGGWQMVKANDDDNNGVCRLPGDGLSSSLSITNVLPNAYLLQVRGFPGQSPGYYQLKIECTQTPLPTPLPTTQPTVTPTAVPSTSPTTNPTRDPTIDPTIHPTAHPTIHPTVHPSADPTNNPTVNPTVG